MLLFWCLFDVKDAIHLCVRREVLETDAVPLPLLAYCKHVPDNTILQTNV